MYCLAGADGFFGSYILKELNRHGEKVLALDHRASCCERNALTEHMPFELTDENCLCSLKNRLETAGESVTVIYLIASHNPDFVRKDPEKAAEVNSVSYRRFLETAASCGVKRLYFASSDTVYGEDRFGRPFSEEDKRQPVNVYGRHKQAAEDLTAGYGFTVCRFPYMFAPSLCGKKHFFDLVTEDLKIGKPVEMFSDYVRSSLSYPKAAELLYRLTQTESVHRVFNICADEPTSKYDIGMLAAERIQADTSLVRAVPMACSSVFTEKRASVLTMSNRRLKETLSTDEKILFGDLL